MAGGLAVFCGGCSEPSETAEPTAELDVEVLVSGCRAPNDAPCTRLVQSSQDPVVAWVDLSPTADLSVEVDGHAVEVEQALVDGGTQLRFQLEVSAATVRIESTDGVVLDREVRWQAQPIEVSIAWAVHHFGVPPTLTRRFLWVVSHFRTGYAALRTRRLLQKFQFGTQQGAESRRTLEALLPLAESLGAEQDVAELAAALAYQQTAGRNYSEARVTMETLERVRNTSPESAIQAALRESELATGAFDHAATLAAYRSALRLARRLGHRSEALYIENRLIVLSSELGLRGEARELISNAYVALETEPIPCSNKAAMRSNLGWAQLRLAAMGHEKDVPHADFEQALEAFTKECPNPSEAANNIANLALAALLDGEITESQRRVRELDAYGSLPRLESFVEDLSREIRIQDPTWHHERPLIAEPVTRPGAGWERWNQHARELRSWGLDEAAIEAFARAEEELDFATTTLPLGKGHGNYVGGRTSSLEGLLELLLESGRNDDALCAVRRARRRAVAQVDRLGRVGSLSPAARSEWMEATASFARTQEILEAQQADAWRGSVAEQRARSERLAREATESLHALQQAMVETLGAPPELDCKVPEREGTATLFAAALHEDVVLFLRDAHGVEVSVVEGPTAEDDTQWGRRALERWEPRLRAASVLRIAASGDLDGHAWARIPVGGRPLVELVSIEYILDVGTPAPQRPLEEALVVADPSSNLAHAREEGATAVEYLSANSIDVHRLEGRDATRPATREQLEGVGLFYFAGHADYDERTPWGSSMKLADGAMGMAELFALGEMPTTAFLMGCETGATYARQGDGGINLGHGFLLAGTERVLVSRVPVDDALARRIGLRTMEHFLETRSLPEALRTTQLELHAEDPELPWWEFRVEAR